MVSVLCDWDIYYNIRIEGYFDIVVAVFVHRSIRLF